MDIKNKKLFYSLFIGYIVLMIVLCVIGTIPKGSNTWEQGATFYFPYDDQVLGTEFNIKGSAYSKNDIESINIVIQPGDIIIPVEMERIIYNNEEILTLSTFSTPVSIEGYGDYSATIAMKDSGGIHEYDQVNFEVPKIIASGSREFKMFSLQHIISFLVVFIAYIIIFIMYKMYPNSKTKRIFYAFIALGIVICDIAVKLWLLKNGVFKASYDAFLHMCDISGPLLIILLFMKDSKNRQRLFSMMFIWGVLGAAMALLTPEMRGNVFPSLYFLTFFIKHGIIVIGVLIVGVIEQYRPRLRHLPIVIVISILIVGLIYGANRLLINIPPFEPGNYMFLSYPPTGGSALDILVKLFGPSPYYIVGMVLLAVILYTLMWVIYLAIEKLKTIKDR